MEVPLAQSIPTCEIEAFILLFRFWGWGGEDDDLFTRVKTEKLTIFRENQELGRFQVLISNYSP